MPPARTADAPNRGPDVRASPAARRIGIGCMVVFFLPFLFAGLGTLFAWFQYQAGDLEVTGDPWVLLILGPVFTLVGAIPFVVILLRGLARRKVGAVDLSLSSTEVRRGDALRVSLRFDPRADFLINEVLLRLVAQEEVVRGSGSHRTTHRHEAFLDRQVPISAHACRPFDPVACEVVFQIPENAPVTFTATSNQLYWQLEARIDIPGWPDWTKDVDLIVDP